MENIMQEQYVSLEIAKVLKKKGFPITKYGWSCFEGKVLDKKPHTFINDNGRGGWYDTLKDWISCPTQSLVLKWLREKHHIIISPKPNSFYGGMECRSWSYDIWADDNFEEYNKDYPTYEDAVEAAIKYCLRGNTYIKV